MTGASLMFIIMKFLPFVHKRYAFLPQSRYFYCFDQHIALDL